MAFFHSAEDNCIVVGYSGDKPVIKWCCGDDREGGPRQRRIIGVIGDDRGTGRGRSPRWIVWDTSAGSRLA